MVSLKDLGSVKYPFIAMTSRFSLIPSIGQGLGCLMAYQPLYVI